MQLQIFKFSEGDSFNDIRTVEIEGQIWFVAKDVCVLLGYKRPENAVTLHCKEKGTLKQGILTAGGMQAMTLINEANVYRLILKSKLPAAEKFEAWLFDEVIPSIRKRGYYGKIDREALPNFITRYQQNFHKLEKNYFSVISEMFARLYMELEKAGYIIPDRTMNNAMMMPDISVGRTFANFLKINNSEFYGKHKKYTHAFPDGREVEANQYPIEALPTFIRFVNEEWIPKYAVDYFKKRDPLALDYLPKLLS